MDLQLSGKSVLITGASRGIGRAAAATFAMEGCSLHLAARSAGEIESLRDETLAKHKVEVTLHPGDRPPRAWLRLRARATTSIS